MNSNRKLIDADALIEAMTKFSNAIGEDMTHGIFYAHIAPTIDAVPVIRCKDCVYFTPEKSGEQWNICRFYDAPKTADGYCNDAEPKETE